MTDVLQDPARPDRPSPPSGDAGPGRPGPRITRRRLLAGAGGAALLAGAGFGIDRLIAGPGDAMPPDGTAQQFVSRPDLRPTVVRYTSTPAAAPGLLFVGPNRSNPALGGAMITDGADLVWFRSVAYRHWATNAQARTLHGRPVLVWWEGLVDPAGYGIGEGFVADTSYRILHRIRGRRGRHLDLHELQITPEGTALFTCTPQTVSVDLSSLGGPASAHALESVIQEVDLATGRLIMEWQSLRHIGVDESYRTEFAPFDYLHVNSIDVLPDGNLLICARNTWCVYKLDRRTGDVIWRLGGKRSDFAMGHGAQFAWAHDARWRTDGRMTIFDDGFDGRTKSHALSRGLVLAVDERPRRVTVDRAYTHAGILTSSMGNVQTLPDGHVLVGFGNVPYSTEFDPDGRVVADLRMPGGQHSYRSYRLPWSALGADVPTAVVRRDRRSGRATLYVSWNGATRVRSWRVDGGASGSASAVMRAVATVPSGGFETSVALGHAGGVVRAVALDAGGRELARSRPVPL